MTRHPAHQRSYFPCRLVHVTAGKDGLPLGGGTKTEDILSRCNEYEPSTEKYERWRAVG